WISAFATASFLTTGSATTNDTYLPSAFTSGNTALSLGLTVSGNRNAAETSPSSVAGVPSQIRSTVYTAGNWTTSATAGALTIPPAVSFTVVKDLNTTYVDDNWIGSTNGQVVATDADSNTPG